MNEPAGEFLVVTDSGFNLNNQNIFNRWLSPSCAGTTLNLSQPAEPVAIPFGAIQNGSAFVLSLK